MNKYLLCTHSWQMSVTVEDQAGSSTNLVVDTNISAIALTFLAASELHLALNNDLTLLEVIDDIGIGKCKLLILNITSMVNLSPVHTCIVSMDIGIIFIMIEVINSVKQIYSIIPPRTT